MDLNEQLKGWLHQQAQPGSFLDKAGLGLAQAGQTIGQDAAAGAAILNDPRNSWIGMNPVGKLAASGLGLAGALGQIVYHGSPHAFEKFALSKIGTGEGAQAYGHGLYLAENPKVAEQYAKTLPYKDFQRKVQEVYSEFDHPDDAVEALAEAGLSSAQLKVMEALKKDDWLGFEYPHQALRAVMSKEAKSYDPSPETLGAVKALHNMYKVDLPDEAIGRMMHWDQPLSAHPQEVQELITKSWPEVGNPKSSLNPFPGDTGTNLYYKLVELTGSEQAASKKLKEMGIPGIKYLDAFSRDGGGTGTRNFVVFDDQLPVIKERGGLELAR